MLTQPLLYHRDAFVSADLELPKAWNSLHGAFDGISMRIARQWDIVNDKFPLRIDISCSLRSPGGPVECAVDNELMLWESTR